MRNSGRAAVVMGSLFGLAGTSTSAVSVALPQLADGLGIDAPTAAWSISAYTVALAVGTPLHGRLADMLGIRAPLVTGVVLLVLGAVVSALTPNLGVLVVARVVQGLGAAALPVLGTALISARWTGSERSAALGRIAGFAATISALGPIVGGGLEAVGGWRLAMLLPVIAVVALPLLWRMAPTQGSGERLDVLGATLVALAAAGLVLVIQSPSAGVVAGTVGAVLLVVAAPVLALWVRRRPTGFLPRAVLTNSTVLRSAAAAAAIPAGWFALLVGVPLTAAAWGWTPLATGALLLPAAAVGLVSPRVAGALIPRLGGRRCLALACPTAAVALLVAAAGAAFGSPVLLALAVVLVTMAFGLGQPAMTSTVSAAVPEELRGVAIGVATLLFLVGASVGAALVGGLASVIGVLAAFLLLVLLPLAGLVALAFGGPDRVEAPVPA